MLDRYSAEASKAVERAADEARQLGHVHVGTEHLLLGLLGDRTTGAARALAAGGASLALCREKVVEALASRASSLRPPPDELPFTDRASRTLERASRLSARLGRDDVLTEDVLLSLLDVEGTAGQVLRGMSVDLTAVRQSLTPEVRTENTEISTPSATSATSLAESKQPLCAKCGAALHQSLGRSEVRSAGVVLLYCQSCGAAVGAIPFPQRSQQDSTGLSSG